MWATAGRPGVEIREIDYAEVLREKQGSAVTIDRLIAAAMDGPQLQLDDDEMQRLLDLLGDAAQVDELMARLDEVAREGGVEVKTAAVITLLRNVAAQAQKDPGRSNPLSGSSGTWLRACHQMRCCS